MARRFRYCLGRVIAYDSYGENTLGWAEFFTQRVHSSWHQCRVEQLALTTLSKTTRAPSRCHGRPRRRKRRLWAHDISPVALEQHAIRGCKQSKGKNPRE